MSQGSQSGETQEGQRVYGLRGGRALYLLILLCLTYLFDYADRMVVGSLIPFIKRDWGLSDQELGSLTSVIYVTIAVFVLPLSLVVDRWSRRKMISIMVFVWSMATLACAFARNYKELLWARALVGLGEAGYAPAGTAVLAGAYPVQVRARTMGIWNAFIPLGAAVGFLAGGYIGQNWGWRHAFGLVAAPGIILAVLFWFTKDYRTVALTQEDLEGKPIATAGLWPSIKELMGIPTLWFVYLAFAMNTAITTCMMTWLPSYFHRFHGMSEQKAGTMAAGLALLVLVGAPLGGFLADRWRRTRLNARMVLSGITSLASAILLALAFFVPHTAAFGPLLVAFGILTVCYVAPCAAVTQDVVHPGLRALSYGLCVICQHLLGGAWSPMLIGSLSDKMGLEKALLAIPLFGLVASGVLLYGSRVYERDLHRVCKVTLLQE
ncbi:MAG: spinster family MFS transporter [Thermodesulfobacteriota bacterium]